MPPVSNVSSSRASTRCSRTAVEWPTCGLLALVYFGWLAAVVLHAAVPVWLLLPVLVFLTTLHASLQHEALHGHPTRHAPTNEILAGLPLGLYIPYRRFKRLHLRHHCNENLTDPYDDPESFYLARADWSQLTGALRFALRVNNTLLGRLIIGPALALAAFYRKEWARLHRRRGQARRVLAAWALHFAGVAVVVALLVYSGFPVWLYGLGVAYPAMSLLMLRTYAEHQAAETADARSVMIEASPFFALLFLNNNLHFVHHKFPNAPWYRLPALYRSGFAGASEEDHYYRISGYGTLFRRYLLSPKESVPHPYRRTAEDVHYAVPRAGGSGQNRPAFALGGNNSD